MLGLRIAISILVFWKGNAWETPKAYTGGG